MPSEGQTYGGPPGSPSQTTGFPENTGFVVFEIFETLNTKPTRPALKDSELWWCDGFMPFGPSNLRTLYGIGDLLYTAPMGLTITAFWFYNFDDISYAAVLLSNGSMVQVATDTGVVTSIMGSGTITNPNPHATSITQWNSKYLVIVSTQDNGFWVWDGTHLYSVGGVSPETSITNAGANYTGQPTIVFQTTATSYVAPTFTATIENGFITEFNVISPGSGFEVDDFVSATFQDGGTDSCAVAVATISSSTGPVIDVITTDPGQHWGIGAEVKFSGGGGGSGAEAVPQFQGGASQSLQITSITVTKGGKGYTTPPTVTISANTGGGWTGFARIGYGEITDIAVTDPGSGYTSAPDVTILGDGQGAQAQARINSDGTLKDITVINGGYGYTKALVVLSGGNNAGAADINLMPFGIQGTTVETYVNRIWVGDDRKGYFTAPSTATNFKPSDGAGVFRSNDSFQRVAYHCFRQTNGFLYLISDSSINYIGGVQTTGDPPATIFNNLNVDPQIGTPWPSTVQLFSRNIVFANTFGIFVSYGGAVTKISGPLDGIYNTVIVPGSGSPALFPSSATASLFGISVYMLLFPIIDPYTGQQVNKLLMWDGKRWWTSNQEISLTYVANLEINSVLTAYGTNGTSIYPLFQQPSSTLTKVVQSKLWANPSYWHTKNNPYVAGLLNFYQIGSPVSVIIENETGQNSVTDIVATSAGIIWTNNSGQVISWTNNSAQPINWTVAGLALINPQTTGQVGVLLGITISTQTLDMSVLSVSLLEQNYATRV